MEKGAAKDSKGKGLRWGGGGGDQDGVVALDNLWGGGHGSNGGAVEGMEDNDGEGVWKCRGALRHGEVGIGGSGPWQGSCGGGDNGLGECVMGRPLAHRVDEGRMDVCYQGCGDGSPSKQRGEGWRWGSLCGVETDQLDRSCPRCPEDQLRHITILRKRQGTTWGLRGGS